MIGSKSCRILSFLSMMVVLILPSTVWGFQRVTPWEYDPYRTVVWLSIDPTLRASDGEQKQLIREVAENLDIAFGPAFDTRVTLVPNFLHQLVLDNLSELSVDDLMAKELVLVMRKDHPKASTIRTLDAALKQFDQIEVSSLRFDEIRQSMDAYRNEEVWGTLWGKLKKSDGTNDEFLQGLLSGKIEAGIVSRKEFEQLGKEVRQVVVRLPWQVDSLLRDKDKLFFVSLRKDGEAIRYQVRELDCPMKQFGSVLSSTSYDWNLVPRAIGHSIHQAFTAVARIEESTNSTAKVRVRASALVANPEHSVLMTPGDVLVPVMRRNDRSGNAIMVQSIPWTYIALTHGDQVNLTGSVFSGTRGALGGRQNRRTVRVAMKVKPLLPATDLRLRMRDKEKTAAAGIAVYRRVPGEKALEMLGRSDWRGLYQLRPIPSPEIEFELPAPSPNVDAVSATDEVVSEPVNVVDSGESVEAKSKPKGKVALKVPLFLYYVRNGDTVLARLPVIAGLNSEEIADLQDDSRRLEAEGLLKGLEGEIIDAVARRKILLTRIETKLKSNDVPSAKQIFEELRMVKNYDRLAADLENIQRKILTPERGTIAPVARMKIDKMFNTTRQMMQKYLQESEVRDIEVRLATIDG